MNKPQPQPQKNLTPNEIKLLNDQLELLKKELEETKNQKLRALADYQNMQKRVELEKRDWIKFANANLLLKIISVCDDLDRASNFLKDPGLEIVRNNFKNILKEYGVTEFEVLGESFNPNHMECIDYKQGEKDKVLEVSQKGYKLHDKILCPAKVIVGK